MLAERGGGHPMSASSAFILLLNVLSRLSCRKSFPHDKQLCDTIAESQVDWSTSKHVKFMQVSCCCKSYSFAEMLWSLP